MFEFVLYCAIKVCSYVNLNLILVDPALIVVQLWEALAERVGNVLKDYPSLNLTHGRKVRHSCLLAYWYIQLLLFMQKLFTKTCVMFLTGP